MKKIKNILLLLLLLLINGCIAQFIPETDEDQDLVVVEGIITDQPEVNTIKLSRSLPIGGKNVAKPMKGCTVTITDDRGGYHQLWERIPGTYVTNPGSFVGRIGRSYTLRISTNTGASSRHYQSYPMELRPVPEIDSVYYKKTTLREGEGLILPIEGCQIYLSTHDPLNSCRYYRWEYSETWEFRLPYYVPNRICWLSANSDVINVKSTVALAEDRVKGYPLKFISNSTDRLKVKYSILVDQYSLNEEEFVYWEKLHNIGEQVGGLYDLIPAAVPSNLWCVENPAEKVLGFFSVSAKSSQRIFIKEFFWGVINLYADCVSDTIFGRESIPNLNASVWIIDDQLGSIPPYRVLSDKKGCADCSVRGTTIEPLFWKDGK